MQPPRTVSGTRQAGPVVLIVHADAATRERLAADVARSGFTVLEAEDAGGAIDQVFRFGPKLVVLALALPGIDGLKVIRRLRLDDRTGDLPIVATGDAPRQEPLAIAAGANAFLCEPFEPARLVARVVRLLTGAAHDGRANGA